MLNATKSLGISDPPHTETPDPKALASRFLKKTAERINASQYRRVRRKEILIKVNYYKQEEG